MRVQRVLESWNPALCVLVSLLGSLVLVAVSVLLRQGKFFFFHFSLLKVL